MPRMLAAVSIDAIAEMQDAAPVWAASILLAVVLCLVLSKRLRKLFRLRRIRRWADGQRNIDALRRISWQEFETITGDAFRRMGYSVEETGGGGADDGADLILRKNGKKYLVSCKKYRGRVGAPLVREAVGAAVFHRARGIYVVGLSGFTPAARNYVTRTKNVRLLDGEKVVEMLKNQPVRKPHYNKK